MAVSPFKISIPDSELDLLKRKLDLARLPTSFGSENWGEDNGLTVQKMTELVSFWKNEYDWRKEEERLNAFPQFKTNVSVDGFGNLDVHFMHSKSSKKNAIPLLFIHGWPGSFMEVYKALPALNEAGFDVVSPSLPGYGFSSYPEKAGFIHEHHATVLHEIMMRLGYKTYVVQGGDWGSFIARTIAIMYPENVKAIHVNMIISEKPEFDKEPQYSEAEKASLGRMQWFRGTQTAYFQVQSTKPRTLGFAMHDSPVGMLAWMADKVYLWTDSYPWTPTELITWTLLHYFPGPTTAFQMYRENNPDPATPSLQSKGYVKQPTGVSHFPKELGVVPRAWAETKANIVFWQVHESGGHFAAYEKPKELAQDVIKFYQSVWKE